MKITITTQKPASPASPKAVIAGRLYGPADPAPDGRPAAHHVRQALYSGQLPRASWAAAERLLRQSVHGPGGARGGSARGPVKRRGDAAYYSWVTACREAARKGEPKPLKPPAPRAG